MEHQCPIGLICELMECRKQVCFDYARPVPLPYEIWQIDYYYPKGALVSELPEYEEEQCNLDYELGLVAHHNHWVSNVRQSMIEGGWGGSSPLPYKWNAELNCLEVDCTLVFEDEDWEFDSGKFLKDMGLYFSYERGFAPPVPIDSCPYNEVYQGHFDEYGFFGYWLMWARDFNEEE